MDFSYRSYGQIAEYLLENGYKIKDYTNYMSEEKTVILRHDIDFDLQKAVGMSYYEKELFGGGATYFLLVSSEFYNVFSLRSKRLIEEILGNNGQIGLHFDETAYSISSVEEMKKYIREEIGALSCATGIKVNKVSMHRPSDRILNGNISDPEFINTYSSEYFTEMKYISDSRMRWREPLEETVFSGKYPRLQILTHPFWYSEKGGTDITQILRGFVRSAAPYRYGLVNENISNLSEILFEEEFLTEK